jgi:hypothetical protein
MFAFYEVVSGSIISVVQASSVPDAPSGYGYVNYPHDKSDTYKYHVVDGVLTSRSQSDVDALEVERATKLLKRKRNQMLASCDWTQVPDAPVDQAAWATYRQQLRDLPASTTDPSNVVWPERPS